MSELYFRVFTGPAANSDGRSWTPASPRSRMRADGIGSARSALDVLGLPAGATQSEIKSKFRRLVASEHPDKNPGVPQAEAKFADIVMAYRRLTQLENKAGSAADYADTRVDDAVAEEIREVLKATRDTSNTVGTLAFAVLALALLTQPLGIWAKGEIGASCTTGNIDKKWCDQLVQLRCVGEFAFGDVQVCLRDGRNLVEGAAGSGEFLDDGRSLLGFDEL